MTNVITAQFFPREQASFKLTVRLHSRHMSVSNYRQLDRLFNTLFVITLTTLSKLRITGHLWLRVVMCKAVPCQDVFMMTSSNGSIFRVTGHLCGEFTGHRWIPHTKASDAELWCFLWSARDKRLSKQSWVWWLETLSRPLWRHCNVMQTWYQSIQS